MVRTFILSTACLISFNTAGHAWGALDSFINTQCSERCNGESDDCIICYNEAVDLYDQADPDSPEVNWGYSGGKFEFYF